MFRIKLILLLCFCFGINTSNAQKEVENSIDISYRECLARDTSVGNICTCAFETYAKWDKMMTREYNRLLRSLKNIKDKTALKQAQTTWVAYRDNEFKSYDNMFNRPGSKWCLLRASGRIDIVKTRAQQLEQYNQAFEKQRR